MAGRRPKKGLDWFKKDIDYYEDFKIIDLLNEYGPLGNTIYDCILCMIYREGYYIEITPEKLAFMIIRVIGNKWVKDKSFVLKVIHYCADIGLFNKSLLEQGVITSIGIQQRFADATSRNKVDKSLYWLIDNDGQSLINAPKIPISATEKGITTTEIPISATEMHTREDKNKSKNKRRVREEALPLPTLNEIISYCKKNSLIVSPERFFNFYEGNGWITASGKDVVNWQAVINNWNLEELNKLSKEENTGKNPSTFNLEEIDKFSVFDL